MCMCVHVGNVGVRDGVKTTLMQLYNFLILSTANEMKETLARPGRQGDAYFSVRTYTLPKRRTTHTMSMQLTVH